MALPVIVICGEAGSGKSTVSDELVEKHDFILVDGDMIHKSPPWNNFGIMHDLCCKFIQENAFMESTIDTIVQEVEKTMNKVHAESAHPAGVVLPFVMYTQQSRTYMAQKLKSLSPLTLTVKFVWLEVDQSIHEQRNAERVEKWAAVGITMHPNDVVDMTKALTKDESLDDCLVINNSKRSDFASTIQTILDHLHF